MKISDYIAQYLKGIGVKCVFGYQGGNIAHTIDSISNTDGIRFISTYNEQGAAFAACGYAYAAQGIGVAIASSGPGAINLISGIANAYYDSIPCIFITGNVSSNTLKNDPNIRQNAFQENDIVAMVKSVTKYSVTVYSTDEIKYHMEKGAFLAQSGRPGPVLLDLPHDIQKAEIDPQSLRGFMPEPKEPIEDLPEKVRSTVRILQKAKRPLIVVGGGAASKRARCAIKELLKKSNIPVVSTLKGLDVVSHDCSCYFGFGGAYGNRYANLALKYSDVLMVVGARLDERFITASDRIFFEKKQVIHADIDANELGRVLNERISINASSEEFLEQLVTEIEHEAVYAEWGKIISLWRERYPSTAGEGVFCANNIIYALTQKIKDNTLFFVDIGIGQMCVAQSVFITGNQRFYTSAGHGAMGFSLPASIGAAYVEGVSNVICLVGDGAFHMNIQEMLMLSKGDLPVHIVLMNNSCLGMIRDYQEKAFCARYAATIEEFRDIDYRAIAKAYHVDYMHVKTMSDVETAIDRLNSQRSGLIEIMLEERSNTIPLLGTGMFTQLPLLTRQEIEEIEEEVRNASI